MKIHRLLICYVLLLFLAFISEAVAAPQGMASEFTAEVRRILDGDTFSARADGRSFLVRLARIDAPQEDQPYGRNARRALEKLIKGRSVQILPIEVDQEGRILAKVSFYGTQDLSAVVVEQGFAWVAPGHRDDPDLIGLESEARRTHRGLWADTQGPIPPWEW